MRIISGISSFNSIQLYAEAGVDEFYIGYSPFDWFMKYGFEVSLNRRYIYSEQILSKTKLILFLKKINSLNKKVYLALNEQFYTNEQLDYIRIYLQDIQKIGTIHGIIVANLTLLDYLEDIGFKNHIHLSGDFGIYNIEALDFIISRYKTLNITRLIFPRELSLSEMEIFINHIKKYIPRMETEAFIAGGPCMFNGSSCRASHGYDNDTGLCETLSYNMDSYGEAFFGSKSCALCFVHHLEKIGISVLKVPTRGLYFLKTAPLINRILEKELQIVHIQNYVKNKYGEHYCSGDNCYYNLNEISKNA